MIRRLIPLLIAITLTACNGVQRYEPDRFLVAEHHAIPPAKTPPVTLPQGYRIMGYCCDDTTVYTIAASAGQNRWEYSLFIGDSLQLDAPKASYRSETFIAMANAASGGMVAIGKTLYTGLLSEEIFHDRLYEQPDSPCICCWNITNSFDAMFFFGSLPADQPANVHIGRDARFIFNPDDSVLVLHTLLAPSVAVYSLDGQLMGEHRLTSRLYGKPMPFSIEQSHNSAETLKFYESNTLFSNLYYDNYRKLYYRILVLPREASGDGMTLGEHRHWVLIVADSNLRKRYEVFFHDCIPTLHITPDGVLISKYNESEADLYLFD
jgi:hypothetical protein